jgi:hypothetical protein
MRNAATPILFHPDLHKRNIFVSDENPEIITSIIDWQSASIEPAFWYADETPDFATPVAHPSLVNQLEPQSEYCAKAFDVCTQFLVPKLASPRMMDEPLFRPFRYCFRTWNDGAVGFRHELIETSRHWKELGFAGSCPVLEPPIADLEAHQKHYKTFEAGQAIRGTMSSLLNTANDGWVPLDDWEATNSLHQELFNAALESVCTDSGDKSPDTANADDDPIRTVRDLKEVWPFDLGAKSE